MRDRFLITGGCGFVGANLIRVLQPEAAHIRVLDDLSLGRREDLAGADVDLVQADIRDRDAVRRALRGIDRVVHLAAHTRVVESLEAPARNFEVNVAGTFALLEEVRRSEVTTFIFASTGGAIMGEQAPPVHEGMVPRPLAPYGASKLCGEAYCSAFAGSFGLRTVSLRFSNIYGPLSWHKGSVIARFFRQILAEQPLVIYGDGNQTRDFLYVEDLCQGIRLAGEYEGPGGEVFHVASGRECSLNELLAAMAATVAPHRLDVRHAPARAGEVSRNFASIAKATTVLGFAPKVELAEGLARTWRWFQNVWRSGHRPTPEE
jgi:UDP-glucose 4-epimerase